MDTLVGITMPGLPEMLLILGVLVLLFGAKKLPELARSIGKSTKEFKAGMREGADEGAPDEEESPDASASQSKPASE